jgi:hypothetical protein
MWSHYADEHRGFCIEYDTTDIEHPNLAPVAYGASRAIKASDLFDWLIKEDQAAYQRVFSTFFFSKSSEWKYEKEWREVCDDHGIKNVEYRMSAIHFGMRCDPAVITSIVKLLDDTDEIDLYNVYAKPNSFRLSRTSVDRDEIAALAIREPAFLMFRRFEEDAKPDVTDVAPE